MTKGVDISRHNGAVNYYKLKEDGIDFVILKAGGSDDGFYKDASFEDNYTRARAAGLHVGAYYFVGPGCVSWYDGEADAKRFLECIDGKQFDYPVYIDLESTSPSNKQGATEACRGFCDYMQKQGYYVGIYASDISGFCDRLYVDRLAEYDKWVARYGSAPKYVKNYGIWQYSDNGKPNGAPGPTDMNESYKDYPTIIKEAGLNGYAKKTEEVKPKFSIKEELVKLREQIDKLIDKVGE